MAQNLGTKPGSSRSTQFGWKKYTCTHSRQGDRDPKRVAAKKNMCIYICFTLDAHDMEALPTQVSAS